MSSEYFAHREPYHNAEDWDQAAATIASIAAVADAIVPGHAGEFDAT